MSEVSHPTYSSILDLNSMIEFSMLRFVSAIKLLLADLGTAKRASRVVVEAEF